MPVTIEMQQAALRTSLNQEGTEKARFAAKIWFR